MRCPACETDVTYCDDCCAAMIAAQYAAAAPTVIEQIVPVSREVSSTEPIERWFVGAGAFGVCATFGGMLIRYAGSEGRLFFIAGPVLGRIVTWIGIVTLISAVILLTRTWSKVHLAAVAVSASALIFCNVMASVRYETAPPYIATAFFWWVSFIAIIVIFTNLLQAEQSRGGRHTSMPVGRSKATWNSPDLQPAQAPITDTPPASETSGDIFVNRSGPFGTLLIWALILAAIIFSRQSRDDSLTSHSRNPRGAPGASRFRGRRWFHRSADR